MLDVVEIKSTEQFINEIKNSNLKGSYVDISDSVIAYSALINDGWTVFFGKPPHKYYSMVFPGYSITFATKNGINLIIEIGGYSFFGVTLRSDAGHIMLTTGKVLKKYGVSALVFEKLL